MRVGLNRGGFDTYELKKRYKFEQRHGEKEFTAHIEGHKKYSLAHDD